MGGGFGAYGRQRNVHSLSDGEASSLKGTHQLVELGIDGSWILKLI